MIHENELNNFVCFDNIAMCTLVFFSLPLAIRVRTPNSFQSDDNKTNLYDTECLVDKVNTKGKAQIIVCSQKVQFAPSQRKRCPSIWLKTDDKLQFILFILDILKSNYTGEKYCTVYLHYYDILSLHWWLTILSFIGNNLSCSKLVIVPGRASALLRFYTEPSFPAFMVIKL